MARVDLPADPSDSPTAGQHEVAPASVSPAQREVCYVVGRWTTERVEARKVARVTASRVYFVAGYPSFIPITEASWSEDDAWMRVLDEADNDVARYEAQLASARKRSNATYMNAPFTVLNRRAKLKAEGRE